jgi:hypothetical protein
MYETQDKERGSDHSCGQYDGKKGPLHKNQKNNSVKSLSEVFLHYIWSIESLNLSCSIKLFKKEKENRSYFFKDMALSTFSLNTDVSIMVPR